MAQKIYKWISQAIKQLTSIEFAKEMQIDALKHERTYEKCIERKLTAMLYPK